MYYLLIKLLEKRLRGDKVMILCFLLEIEIAFVILVETGIL